MMNDNSVWSVVVASRAECFGGGPKDVGEYHGLAVPSSYQYGSLQRAAKVPQAPPNLVKARSTNYQKLGLFKLVTRTIHLIP